MPSISGMGVSQQREYPGYTHGKPEPPLPYFGKKTKCAPLVWERLGRVHTYIEPCCGSLAMALMSPYGERPREVYNDVLGHVCNFHRSMRDYPRQTASAADRPTTHQDLAAAVEQLREAEKDLTEKQFASLSYCDPELAGLWVWASCVSIGLGANLSAGYDSAERYTEVVMPAGPYHHEAASRDALSSRPVYTGQRLEDWFVAISNRIRRAYILCKDWSTLFSPAVLDIRAGAGEKRRVAGIFFDPPYAGKEGVYAQGGNIAQDIFDWAVKHGDDPRFRICLAGYGDDYAAFPDGWQQEKWTRQTGMEATAGKNYDQASAMAERQESLWFSPHCIQVRQGVLV